MISLQLIDNKAVVHEIEFVFDYGKCQTTFWFELVYAIMVAKVLIPGITFKDITFAVFLFDVIHEIFFIYDYRNWFVSEVLRHFKFIYRFILILWSFNVRVKLFFTIFKIISEHLWSDDVVLKLRPDVSLEMQVSLLTHVTLNDRTDDEIILLEDVIVVVRLRLEQTALNFSTVRVNEQQVQFILTFLILVFLCPLLWSCHEKEVWAAFDSQIPWVEANIFKLVELNPTDKFIFFGKIKNVASLFINKESVLKNQLGISQVVSNTWTISHNVLELISFPDYLKIVFVVWTTSWRLLGGCELCKLITISHMNSLVSFTIKTFHFWWLPRIN